MEIIQANGATLAGVLISLDRQERGVATISAIQEVERDYGCKVISIITLTDLIAYLEEKPGNGGSPGGGTSIPRRAAALRLRRALLAHRAVGRIRRSRHPAMALL